MKTYKELLDVLSKLSEKQLKNKVQFIAVGCPECEAPTLECSEIASSFDLVLADSDIIHSKFGPDSYQEDGYTDSTSLEELEEDKEDGQVNTIAVKEGDPVFICTVEY